MPRNRMTVRRWMLLIAIVAFAVGPVRLAWVAYSRRGRAHSDRELADLLRRNAQVILISADRQARSDRDLEQTRSSYDQHQRMAAYFEALGAKWDNAARSPWAPVAADPPVPR